MTPLLSSLPRMLMGAFILNSPSTNHISLEHFFELVLSWILVRALYLRECQPAIHMPNYTPHEKPSTTRTHTYTNYKWHNPACVAKDIVLKLESLVWGLTHISPLCPAALRVVLFVMGWKTKHTKTFFMALLHSFQKIPPSLRGVFRQITMATEYCV